MTYRFGDCELDADRVELRHRGDLVAVEPQVFEVLVHLVRHRDRLVTKEELLDEIWGDRFVSESALTSRIKSARQAVGDDGTNQSVIRTVHGRGYRFVAEVSERDGPSAPETPSTVLLAFLMTDIERSVQAWNREPALMEKVVAEHDSLVRDALEGNGGEVFKHTGDGMCAAFWSPTAAVTATIAAQRSLQSHRWPDGLEPQVRMALHLGEAVARDGDFFGPALNKTARLLDIASGAQVVLSRPLLESAQVSWPADVVVHDEGQVLLDDFGATDVHQLTWPGSPPRRALRARRPGGPPMAIQAKALVGRDTERDELRAALDQHSMVTLVGTAGVGKTHLAMDVAAERAAEGGSVLVCELAAIRDQSAVGKALLAAVGAIEQSDADAGESALRALEPRTALLVLDNCEHLRQAIAALCVQVRWRCPGVTILATSRQRLGVGGERVFPLEPLGLDDAVAVFVERASALGGPLDRSDPAIARVCERLDCIPLAVELASATSHVLAPRDLEALLADRLDLLEASGPDRPDHHRTLDRAIAWSYDGLDEGHRLLLQRLSTFAGSFDLEAAIAVGRAGEVSRPQLVRQLLDLCERSLVVAQASASGGGRYRLLESIRIFADSRMDDRDRARGAHVAHFTAVAEAAAATQDPAQVDALQRALGTEWDNLRAAFEYAEAARDQTAMVRLVNAVATYAELTQSFEVIDWCERAMGSGCEQLPDEVARDGLANWSRLLSHRSDFARAGALAERAAMLGESPAVSTAEFWRGWTAGDFAVAEHAARRLHEQTGGTASVYEAAQIVLRHFLAVVAGIDAGDSLRRLEELAGTGSQTLRAFYELSLGMSIWKSHRTADEALVHFETARAIASQLGLWVIVGGAITNRSIVLAFEEDLVRAARGLRDGLREYVDNGMWTTTSADLPVAARVLNRVGDERTAAVLLGARDASRFQGGESTRMVESEVARSREVLGDEFDRLFAEGRTLKPPRAARLAIEALARFLDDPTVAVPSSPLDE